MALQFLNNGSITGTLTISSSSNQLGLDTGDLSGYGRLDIGHFTNGAFIGTTAGSNSGSNVLRFGTSGAEKMRINTNGNVGIGKTAPEQLLHVGDGSDAARGIVAIEGAGGSHLIFSENSSHASGANAYCLRPASGTNFIIQQDGSAASALTIDTGANATFAGKVNIGAITGAAKPLLVKSPSNNTDVIVVEHSGNTVPMVALGQGSNHGYLNIRNNGGASQVFFNSAGNNSYLLGSNFGIGTTSPETKLDVNGILSLGGQQFAKYDSANDLFIVGDLDAAGAELALNVDAGEAVRINATKALKFNAYNSTNNTGTPTYLLGTDASGNIVKTLSTPGALPGFTNTKSRAYTSLTGSSNDYFTLFRITDTMGPVNCKIYTYAHDCLEFSVAEGYGPSNAGAITIINSVNTANGGFATVSAVRINQNGYVEVKLFFSTGPTVNIGVIITGYNVPDLVTSLATSTQTASIVDSVSVDVTGILRSKSILQVGGSDSGNSTNTVFLTNAGNSWINGNAVNKLGIGTSSPATQLTLGTGSTGISFQSSVTTLNSGKIAVIKPVELGNGNGELVFETYKGGSGGGERMRIDNDGNIKFNTYGAGTLRSDASGNITSVTSGAGTGTVTGTGVNNRLAIWNGTTAIDSDSDFFTTGTRLVSTQLAVGDGTDGYFYSDTAGRTAFGDGSFYIKQTVPNYYNYATNQYHGNSSGDNHFFRGNPLTGNNWSIAADGTIEAERGFTTDGLGKSSTWTVNNTASNSGYKKIMNWYPAGQSSRMTITASGGFGYGNGGNDDSGLANAVFTVNNGNLLSGSWWFEGADGVINFYWKQISTSPYQYEIHIQYGQFSEFALQAVTSDGYMVVANTASTPNSWTTLTKKWNVNNQLYLNNAGNVGIGTGTTSLTAKLNVVSPLSSNGIGVDFQTSGGSGYGMNNLVVEVPGYGTGIKIQSPTTSNVDNGAMAFFQVNTKVGSIQINTSSTSYNTTSDYRLKENKEDISDAIERVKQLKPVKFNWIKEPNGSKVDGFYAHELADIVPEAVTGEKDALDHDGNPSHQAIDQSKIVPLLTAALQQAIDKIEALELKINKLNK
jgi:hypothetical protein